jgi:hypothetical protein
LLLLVFSFSAFSQNTKGDRPSGSRDNRFKIGQKKSSARSGPRTKRIKLSGKSASNSGGPEYTPRRRARGGERAGRPIKPVFSVKEPSERQRAWKGDISGRKVRHKNQSSSGDKPYVHPQRGRFVRRTPREKEGRQNVASGRPVRIKSATGRVSNVYPQRGKFVHNPSSKPRDTQRAVSNSGALARVRRMETRQPPPGKKVRVTPRSASSPYIRNKSINIYANFRRPRKKGERAVTTDIAGRKLRTRNYQTPAQGISKAPNPYSKRKRIGEDRPYRGPSGYYKSVSGKGRRAWIGDITNRRVGNRSSKKSIEGTPTLFRGNRSATRTGRPGVGGGYRSATRTGRVGTPVGVRTPGIGAQGIGNYRGNRRGLKGFVNQGEQYSGAIKSRKRISGGGSVSGRRWNNGGVAISARQPGIGARGIANYRGDRRGLKGFRNQGEQFTGTIKARRPAKGGGSVSKSGWNNSGSPVSVRQPVSRIPAYPGKMKLFRNKQGFNNQGEEYTGGIKTRRPAKGGGSVSGKLWNNNETAIEGKQPGTVKGLNFSGNIKTRRPAKGGGSVSGRLWNNNETPIEGRQPVTVKGLNYSGNIKARRPQKGGGSVSGKLWNNDETPIIVKVPPASAKQHDGYPGKWKRFQVQPGFVEQGEEYTGNIRLSRLRKAYIQNDKAHEESIKKKRPEKGTYRVNGLQVKVERRDYVRNKDVPEESLMKLKPTRTDREVSELHVKVRQYKYIRNRNSSEDALKVREPGKAFARATDYQGNIKMQRVRFFDKNRDQYPDSRFVKTNKNNVREERDAMTNLKLWWARLFKKQESQPDHLKEKGRKPRYDKGEQGMWYD